jgi:Helix-turn-helix domain
MTLGQRRSFLFEARGARRIKSLRIDTCQGFQRVAPLYSYWPCDPVEQPSRITAKYRHLTQKQRYTIQALQKMGHPQKFIAETLEVSPSTISRELRRDAKANKQYAFQTRPSARARSSLCGQFAYPLRHTRCHGTRTVDLKSNPSQPRANRRTAAPSRHANTLQQHDLYQSAMRLRKCNHAPSGAQAPKRVMNFSDSHGC